MARPGSLSFNEFQMQQSGIHLGIFNVHKEHICSWKVKDKHVLGHPVVSTYKKKDSVTCRGKWHATTG
jgi:hypothetical protein